MKLLIMFGFLISINAWSHSADYVCDAKGYRLDLFLTDHTSSHLSVKSPWTGELVQSGYVMSIEIKGDKSIYHFYAPSEFPLKLVIKTQDAKNLPAKLPVYLDTYAEGLSLREKAICEKR